MFHTYSEQISQTFCRFLFAGGRPGTAVLVATQRQSAKAHRLIRPVTPSHLHKGSVTRGSLKHASIFPFFLFYLKL